MADDEGRPRQRLPFFASPSPRGLQVVVASFFLSLALWWLVPEERFLQLLRLLSLR